MKVLQILWFKRTVIFPRISSSPVGAEQGLGRKSCIHIRSGIKRAGSSETMVSSHEGIWRRNQEERNLRSTSHIKIFRSIQVFLLELIT